MSYLDALAVAVRAAVASEQLPEADDLDDLFRLYAVLARAKGTQTTASDVHDAWAAWMISRGASDHEAIKPYRELDPETQRADEPFVEAIHAVTAA